MSWINLFSFSQGLYRQDERFGPGVLTYKSIEGVDVGFWLGEYLVRLLYPHPTLNMDIEITDRKSSNDSSFTIPSWYSPQELLSSVIDLDFLLKKKPSTLFCKNIDNNQSSLQHYLVDHSNRVQDAMYEQRAQLDAYLFSINNEQTSKEKILHEHAADLLTPNETYEQRQLYYYINKFWPLKQRATFPIEDILSSKSKFNRMDEQLNSFFV